MPINLRKTGLLLNYGGRMVKMVPKRIAILFLLFFLSGILIAILQSLVPLPNVPEMVDPAVLELVSVPLILLGLVVVYYFVNYVSREKGMISVLTIFLTLAFAWLFAGFSSAPLEALLGMPRNFLYVPLYFVGLAIGIVVGYSVAKRIYKEESGERRNSLPTPEST